MRGLGAAARKGKPVNGAWLAHRSQRGEEGSEQTRERGSDADQDESGWAAPTGLRISHTTKEK